MTAGALAGVAGHASAEYEYVPCEPPLRYVPVFLTEAWHDLDSDGFSCYIVEEDGSYTWVRDSNNLIPVTPDGPILSLAFGEGTGSTAEDLADNGAPATISGGSWGAGKVGSGLLLGRGDSVTVAPRDTLGIGGDMTVEAWVRPASADPSQTLFTKERAGGLGYQLFAAVAGGAPGALLGRMWGGEPFPVAATDPLVPGRWSHVALVVGDEVMRLYVDGVEVASQAIEAHGAPSGFGALRIGATGPGEQDGFAGEIDEVRVYDRTLTAAEVVADRDTPIDPVTVRIATPHYGDTVSGDVLVRAEPADPTGVSVRFEIDGSPLGELDTEAPFEMTWSTEGTWSGEHEIRGVLYRHGQLVTRTSRIEVLTP